MSFIEIKTSQQLTEGAFLLTNSQLTINEIIYKVGEDIPVSVYINSFSLVYESPVPNATSAQTKLSWEA